MGSRRLGLALIGLGLIGLLGLSVVGATGAPPVRSVTYGPGWMGGMHRFMHGGSGVPGWWAWSALSPSPGAREIRVTTTDFAFSPDRIELRAGETVNLVLVNGGSLPHDLTIPALGFSLAVEPGETASGALTVLRPGTFRFLCSVPGHRAAGMVGSLVVA